MDETLNERLREAERENELLRNRCEELKKGVAVSLKVIDQLQAELAQLKKEIGGDAVARMYDRESWGNWKKGRDGF